MPMRSAPSRKPATSSIPPPQSACMTISIRREDRASRKTPMSPSVVANRNPTRYCAAVDYWTLLRRPDRRGPLDWQMAADRRQKEDRDVDQKPETPQDRAQRRAVADIGEDIGNPYDQKQHRELIDQPLRAAAKLGKQHRNRKERECLDAVLVCAQRPRRDRVLVEAGVARPRIVEAASADPFDRHDRQQIQHQRPEYAPFSGRHGSSREART